MERSVVDEPLYRFYHLRGRARLSKVSLQMPLAFFTSTPRAKLVIGDAFPSAEHLSSNYDEDAYAIGDCTATCRYRTAPGDFVSKQILGCHNAVRTGRLNSSDVESTLCRIAETQTVIGLIGTDELIAEIVTKLSLSFPGVVVSATEATMAGQ